MVLWGIGLGLAIALRSAWAIALCGSALMHLGFDFLLHHDDGRAHFWPLSNWIFQSPVSYWDPAHYGTWVGMIEISVSLILCVVIWRRFQSAARHTDRDRRIGQVEATLGSMFLSVKLWRWLRRYGMRLLVIVLALAEAAPTIIFSIMFLDN
jgi:hypothetical protein